MTAPITPQDLAALRVCADTPTELERLLTVYSLGYRACEADKAQARLDEMREAA